jgi:hypothetical protein
MHIRRSIQALGLSATLALAGASAFAQTTDGPTTREP